MRPNNRKNFENKVVVVTGAASGIGAAISSRFARERAKVGLLDVDAGGIQNKARELADQGSDVVGLSCDVADRQECESAIGKIISRFGGIDVLVNNAGITQRSAFKDTRVDVFKKVMEINFFGALYCTKAALESLIDRRGTIIVIESIAGISPLLGRSGYCASKHALHGLFTSLRSEIRSSGVHIMIVCPGFVKTNLQQRALGGDGQVTFHSQSKVGKEILPADVADAVYQGALKEKSLLILSPVGKLTYWISRFAPVLYERLMARQLSDELKR
jgi:NAD(P)-dependent dehydrogenase (short-subunit alcohol dehydrogenase family)